MRVGSGISTTLEDLVGRERERRKRGNGGKGRILVIDGMGSGEVLRFVYEKETEACLL